MCSGLPTKADLRSARNGVDALDLLRPGPKRRTRHPTCSAHLGFLADASWSVYASRAYLERHGRPDNPQDLKGHLVIACDGSIVDYPGARWQRSVAHQATVAARTDHWQGLILAVKAGAGLAAMPHFQGDAESELVRVIDDIGLVVPYYLLMHRDMQHTPRVRAFADFVSSEIKSFRALLSNSNVAHA
jgi:DNA-binding transcriptional LysR family regulator